MRLVTSARLRKTTLLAVIAGTHGLLLWNMDLGRTRRLREAEEAPGVLYFVDIPETADLAAVTPSPASRRRPVVDSGVESEATRSSAISLPSAKEGPIDWNSEASRVAGEVIERESVDKKYRSLDRPPPGLGPPPPGSSRHQFGDTQRFEGGEIITWINDRCYYSNKDFYSAYGANSPFADLQVQRPVCKGAPPADKLQSFEEWKKQR